MEAPESDEPHSMTPPGVRSWWHARWGHFKRRAFRSEMLLYWTLFGVAIGAVVGSAMSWLQPSERVTELIGYPGELLMRALRELVLPLVALALLTGVLNLRHTTTGSSRIARWALQFYLLSMLLAVALAIGLIYTIRPGRSQPLAKMARSEECKTANLSVVQASRVQASADPLDSVLNIGRDIVPVNIVQAAADANFLGVIAISIFFGVVLSTMGEEAEPLIQNIEIANKAVIKMILYIVWLTPLGVSSLVAGSILRACDLVLLLKSLALYVVTILAGFGIHCFVVLPTLLYMYTRKDPFKAVRSFLPAFAMGFGTGSSAATMPMTMQCALDSGCQEGVVSFVIPLGTSVNRDGAALYEAASVLFIAQAHGLGLSAGSVVLIAVTSTLAAVGAASVPMSALVTMITVLQAVNLDQFVGDVSILLAVDWCLGMFRTVTNIWGDCVAAMCVDHLSRQHEAAQSRREDSKEQEMLEEEIRLVDSEWGPERPIQQNFRPRTLSPIRGNLRKEVTPTNPQS